MTVLIIPEDFRKDQYILKPLFTRLFRSIGGSRARVRVCQDPLLGSVEQALHPERIQTVVASYDGMTDIFILCVDRDGKHGRQDRLEEIESRFGSGRIFFAANAWEELETWVLAGLTLPAKWRWQDVRSEVQVKEVYFDVLVNQLCLTQTRGGGRKELGEKSAQRIDNIRRKCREDFDSLARRIESVLAKI